MLTALIEGADELVDVADHQRAVEVLEREHARLGDAEHLVRDVIEDPGEFAWDFDVLQEGFLDPARPFLAESTGIGGLYLTMLQDLGADRDEHAPGILILEYMRLATRINDHFNFHDELSKHVPDFREAERLVQLRYTAQFLNNYPRYTIRRNVFGASDDRLIRLHRWGTNVFTTVGISRACFTRWCHLGFVGVKRDPYRQNAINALCESFQSPASVAMILAGVEPDAERTCRRAFSWLQLAVNARVERRALEGQMPTLSPEADGALLPVTFPGMVYLRSPGELKEAASMDGERRFPRIRVIHEEATRHARAVYDDAARAMLIDEEQQALERFCKELAPTGLFQETAKRFQRAFAREVAR